MSTPRYRWLTFPWQRAWGALFRRRLGHEVLIFAYARPAVREFHTYFCPPLRLLALDEHGQVSFDQVLAAGQKVCLPRTRFVVEADPAQALDLAQLAQLATIGRPRPLSGSWHAQAQLDQLFLALLEETARELQHFQARLSRSSRIPGENLRALNFYQRCDLVSVAAFILSLTDLPVPVEARRFSRQVLQAERAHLPEMFAAGVALSQGWRAQEDFQWPCTRCQKRKGTWQHPALTPPHLSPGKRLAL